MGGGCPWAGVINIMSTNRKSTSWQPKTLVWSQQFSTEIVGVDDARLGHVTGNPLLRYLSQPYAETGTHSIRSDEHKSHLKMLRSSSNESEQYVFSFHFYCLCKLKQVFQGKNMPFRAIECPPRRPGELMIWSAVGNNSGAADSQHATALQETDRLPHDCLTPAEWLISCR